MTRHSAAGTSSTTAGASRLHAPRLQVRAGLLDEGDDATRDGLRAVLDAAGLEVCEVAPDDALARAGSAKALTQLRSCDFVVARLGCARAAATLLARLQRRPDAPPLLLLLGEVEPAQELELLDKGCAWVLGGARHDLLPHAVRRMRDAAAQLRALGDAGTQLRRVGERFEAVFAHAPTSVLVFELDAYRLLEANPVACRMFDLPQAGLDEVSLPSLVHAQDLGALHAAVRQLRDGVDTRVRLELRMCRRDGNDFWGDLSLACLGAVGGVPGSLIAHVLNISLRKQAEASAADTQAELERRVREKTADLVVQRRRVESLYAISSQVAAAQTMAQMGDEFVVALRRLAAADAVVLRRCDPQQGFGEVLAAAGVPREECLLPGNCDPSGAPDGACGIDAGGAWPRCLPAHARRMLRMPVVSQGRRLAVLDLAYAGDARLPGADELPLLEAAVGHLASGMEALRSAALEREAAVAAERGLLARELHDSIAQALAFMNIQLEILRSALQAADAARTAHALEELDAGLRESSEDVRELLLHFRTRTTAEDIAPAIRSTLQKFELQCAVPVQLDLDTRGRSLDADVQVQLLHILQEALSNVRKHACATRVHVVVRSIPHWRIEVRDDGRGFDPAARARDAQAHVGLQIMRERAAQIGATVRLRSRPGEGTEVVVERAPPHAAAGAGERRLHVGGA